MIAYDQIAPSTDPNAVARYSDCGECAVASILTAAGRPTTPEGVIALLGHDSYTATNELLRVIQNCGAPCTPCAATDFAARLNGTTPFALLLIRDNAAGDPDPSGLGLHWIAAYALTAAGDVLCANSWPNYTGHGRLLAYHHIALAAAVRTAVLVGRINTPGTVTTAPPFINTPPVEAPLMLIVNAGAAGIFLLSGSMYVLVDDPTVYASLQATGLKQWAVDPPQHALLLAAAQTAKLTGTVPVSGALTLG